jgi:hypothetical protein
MQRIPALRVLPLLVTATLLAASTATVEAQLRPPQPIDSRIPPEVFGAVLEAGGRVLRDDSEVRVKQVAVRARFRSTYRGLPDTLFSVRVRGDFPPRALRYEVRAGGRTVGYGFPSASGRAIQTVTRDRAVLTERVRARYEGVSRRGAQSEIERRGLEATKTMPNPGAGGPLAVTRSVYDFGDQVFQPSDLGAKVELTADVHYPTDLPGGPYPLVVFMHGNHTTCYKGLRATFQWPCKRGWEPLPNYAGYDYIADALASHGFVVASISANGVNVHGGRVRDTGMRQRGELLDRHLDLWKEWSTTGGEPFNATFVDKVDMTRIGTMGHSRGGEGVVWHKIVDEERPDPYGVDAVLALAPVDFTRAKINEAAFSVILPYCDGDVSDLQGMHFFDDSRYAVPGDPTPKHTVTAFGANHNFFNTVWSPGQGYPGAFDDGRWSECTNRLSQPQQRRLGRAYVAGFFRRYLADEADLDPMWSGAAAPASIAPARTLVSYLAPDTPRHRLDLARFMSAEELSTGINGTNVSGSGLSLFGWCANTFRVPCVPGRAAFRDVHLPGLHEGLMGWSNHKGVLRLELAEDREDVSSFETFQFRAVVNPGYPANGGLDYQDLTVALIDNSGNSDEMFASEVGNEALDFPLTGRRLRGHVILNQVRFPLDGFEGVDLGDLQAVEIRFDRTRRGVLNLADVAFSKPPG